MTAKTGAERVKDCRRAAKKRGVRRIPDGNLQPSAALALDRLSKHWGTSLAATVNRALIEVDDREPMD